MHSVEKVSHSVKSLLTSNDKYSAVERRSSSSDDGQRSRGHSSAGSRTEDNNDTGKFATLSGSLGPAGLVSVMSRASHRNSSEKKQRDNEGTFGNVSFGEADIETMRKKKVGRRSVEATAIVPGDTAQGS